MSGTVNALVRSHVDVARQAQLSVGPSVSPLSYAIVKIVEEIERLLVALDASAQASEREWPSTQSLVTESLLALRDMGVRLPEHTERLVTERRS